MSKADSNGKAMGLNCLALSAALACSIGHEEGDSASGNLPAPLQRHQEGPGAVLVGLIAAGRAQAPTPRQGRARGTTSASIGAAPTLYTARPRRLW